MQKRQEMKQNPPGAIIAYRLKYELPGCARTVFTEHKQTFKADAVLGTNKHPPTKFTNTSRRMPKVCSNLNAFEAKHVLS